MNYQETEVEAQYDGVGDGHGCELDFPEVAGEDLGDHVHGVHRHSSEDGGACYLPYLLRLDPDPSRELLPFLLPLVPTVNSVLTAIRRVSQKGLVNIAVAGDTRHERERES